MKPAAALACPRDIPPFFPGKFVSSSKQSDSENRTKRVESRGPERNRPFAEQCDDSADWPWPHFSNSTGAVKNKYEECGCWVRAFCPVRLTGSFRTQNSRYGLQQYVEIKPRRPIADVEKILFPQNLQIAVAARRDLP
jgi:hypothetical protein